MKTATRKNWTIFILGFCMAFLGSAMVHAATLRLIAWVSNPIYDEGGVGGTPLVDGSVVQIIGSGDAIIGGFQSVGTNLDSRSTVGDDVLLGTVRINSNDLGVAGTFLDASITFDSDQISNLYLRVFNTTTNYPQGLVYWGTSAVTNYNTFFDVAFADFGGNFATTNLNNFVVIPEPGTGQLILIFIVVALGLRASFRKKQKEAPVVVETRMPDRF